MTSAASPTLAFLAFSASKNADTPTPITRAIDHLAAARAELDRLILADVGDTLDLRIYDAALYLDAAPTPGGEPA